jgi:inosine/xanthosine triphosphatase
MVRCHLPEEGPSLFQFDTWQAPRRVAVGSTNPSKVEAVRAILAKLAPEAEVVGLEVPSGVPAQPVGLAETRKGAQNRATAALAAAQADLGVGLEGGVEFDADGCWVINVAVVVDRQGRAGHAQGLRMLLPPYVGSRIQQGLELGDVIDELARQQNTRLHAGAVGVLTDGAINRRLMWEMAFASALPPLLHPGLYPPREAAPEVTRDFAVSCFVLHAGKLLLLWHRKLAMWLPPGGHVDAGELPDDAAVREVLEETGLTVELMSQPAFTGIPGPRPLARPEGVQLEDIAPNHQHIDFVYFARVAPGQPAEIKPNLAESGRVAWFTPAEVAALPLTAEMRKWCELAFAAGERWSG